MNPSSSRACRLSLRKKLCFSLLTCVLLFTSTEVTWRLVHGWNWTWLDCHRYHPVLGWCLREGWEGKWEWTAGKSKINPQGLRDDRRIGDKRPGEKRLLVLGDSLTFGAKVRTDETYVAQMERSLSEAGHPWRVLNGGVTGYDPAQEADWLTIFGLTLQPDALAIGFCWNDIYPSDRADWLSQHAASHTTQWLNEHSIAFFRFQRGLQRLQSRLPRAWGQKPPELDLNEIIPRNWHTIEEAYRRIALQARERGLPVYLIIFPSRCTADGSVKDDLRERLLAFCKKVGWQPIDLLEVFRADPNALFLNDDFLHPSVEGNRRAGMEIARQLLQRRLLPGEGSK